MKDYLPVLSAVIAAISAIWVALRNLARQHEHDRQMRKGDRDLQLKKQIYIDALPVVDALVNIVPSLSDTRGEVDEIMGTYIDKSPEFSAMLLVASERTAGALSQLKRTAGETIGEMLPLAHQIRDSHNLYNQRIADRRTFHRLLNEKLANNPTEANLDAIERIRERVDVPGVAAIQELEDRISGLKMVMGQVRQKYYQRIVDPHLELIASMRSDLGDPIDATRYRRVFATHLLNEPKVDEGDLYPVQRDAEPDVKSR